MAYIPGGNWFGQAHCKIRPAGTAFQECCQKTSCKNLALQHPVATQWKTHCECLGHLLEQWAAVECLCESPVHSRLNLEKYLLKEHKWDLLEALRPLLKVCLLFQLYFIFWQTRVQMFADRTNHISQSEMVLIHQVIPIIDILTEKLQAVVRNTRMHMTHRESQYSKSCQICPWMTNQKFNF